MAYLGTAARERRERRFYESGLLAAALLILSTTQLAYQDSISLVQGERANFADRWTARLVATPDGPKLVTASAKAGARVAAVDANETGSIARSSDVQLNRRLKGDRLDHREEASVTNSGSLYLMSSFTRAGSEADLPRSAFAAPALATGNVFAAKEPEKAPEKHVEKVAEKVAVKATQVAAVATEPTVRAYADPNAGANDKQSEAFKAVIAVPKDKPSVAFKPDPNDHFWMANPIPQAAKSKAEQKCLAEAIYFESRGEPIKGQQAVAQVVINRLKNPTYPDTICGVVYQNKNQRNACQFSFACDGIPDRVANDDSWKTAQEIARNVLTGEAEMLTDVGSSTHYHATYVRPRWAKQMKKMQKIGRHVFYKTYGGGWI